jgi:transposase
MERISRHQWVKWIEQWRRSGLSASEFADRVGVKERTLRYWKWLLGYEARSGVSPPALPTPFVEVVGVPAETRRDLELRLPSGVRVRVPSGFLADDLARVLRILEGR